MRDTNATGTTNRLYPSPGAGGQTALWPGAAEQTNRKENTGSGGGATRAGGWNGVINRQLRSR